MYTHNHTFTPIQIHFLKGYGIAYENGGAIYLKIYLKIYLRIYI